MLVGRQAEGFDDAPFNRMEGWGPDCHKWTGASMARPAEKCGPGISKTVLRSKPGETSAFLNPQVPTSCSIYRQFKT